MVAIYWKIGQQIVSFGCGGQNRSSSPPFPSFHVLGFSLKSIFLIAALCCYSVSLFAVESIEPEKYVTIKNGHLYKDGKRLRQWGVNLQSGMFKTYSEIDRLVDRLKNLGLNAVRIWPTADTFYGDTPESSSEINVSKPGDGSALDRFDYLIHRLSSSGMTIQMTMLHYFGLPAMRAMRDPEISQWVEPTRSDLELRRVMTFAPYLSKGYRERLKRHISDTLKRTNPYTGRRYLEEPSVSAWELANEASFVPCAMSTWCLDALPIIARETLQANWQASMFNPQKSPLPENLGGKGNSPEQRAYRQYLAAQFIQVSNELRDYVRQLGGDKSGVAVQPIIFNTGIGDDMATAHYAHGAGDVLALGAYHSPLSKTNGVRGSPWRPIVMGGPRQSLLENVRIKDKPVVIYETSFIRPYPFRAEFGPAMAAIALQQDWDSVFLYQYGQPWIIYSDRGEPTGYGTKALPEPEVGGKGEQGSYYFGFHHGGDPVVMASWSVGASLFLQAPEHTEATTAVWDIPLNSVFSDKFGYPKAFNEATGSKRAQNDQAIAVRFVTDRVPNCAPCVLGQNDRMSQISINWQDSAGGLRVSTPGGTALVGMLDGNLGEMASGISAQVQKSEFGMVAAIYPKGGRENVVRIITAGDAQNTGWILDPSKVEYSGPAGAFNAVTSAGKAPIIFTGPAVRWVVGPGSTIREFDFGLTATAFKPVGASFVTTLGTSQFAVDVEVQPRAPID